MGVAALSFALGLIAQVGSVSSAATSTSFDRLVDMVVAQVDDEIITYSELIAEANLLLLDRRGASVAQSARLNRDLLRAVLSAMVNRELLLGEIRRLQLRPVDREERTRRLVALRRKFDSEADWRRFLVRAGFRDRPDPISPVPPALEARLRDEAQVERFLDVRIRLNVVISDRDVAECYRAQRSVFGAPLATVTRRIRTQLRAQREAAALRTLIDQLKRRATIRYDEAFEPEPSPADPPPVRAAGSGFTCPAQ